MITKGERAELRSIIRQRFKVLRADVEARESELVAELDSRIQDHFSAADKAWSDLAFVLHEAGREANRKANDAVRDLVGRDGWPHDHELVQVAGITRIRANVSGERPELQERSLMKSDGARRIRATVKAAQLRLDRQEADLLTRLVAGGLESEEARAFLGEIPTVSALVPSDRLLELERSLSDGAE